MRRAALFFAFAALAFASTVAGAVPFSLNFSGLQNGEEVLTYFDGGSGSLGSNGGPNYGIAFTPSFIAVQAFPPPPGGFRVGELNGPSAIMDVAAGFTNLFSFYYDTSMTQSGTVTLWSGLDGTGSQLGSISLLAGQIWQPAGVSLSGLMVDSVVFSGTPGIKFLELNNIGYVVPEPSSWLLIGTGLLAGVGTLRRKLVRPRLTA